MERKFQFCADEFYHVYNRGNDKRKIFESFVDYQYFQKLLYICNSTNRIILRDLRKGEDVYSVKRDDEYVHIGSYCLMPNHFHLLIYEKTDGGISKFMAKLSTAYVVYFNHKYKRTGGLFEGCFKAKEVVDDQYMQYLHAYIALNPIKLIQKRWKEDGIEDINKAKQHLAEYKYSSYLDQTGIVRRENSILEKSNFPEYFDSGTDFKHFVNEWLEFGSTYNTDGTELIDTQDSPVC